MSYREDRIAFRFVNLTKEEADELSKHRADAIVRPQRGDPGKYIMSFPNMNLNAEDDYSWIEVLIQKYGLSEDKYDFFVSLLTDSDRNVMVVPKFARALFRRIGGQIEFSYTVGEHGRVPTDKNEVVYREERIGFRFFNLAKEEADELAQHMANAIVTPQPKRPGKYMVSPIYMKPGDNYSWIEALIQTYGLSEDKYGFFVSLITTYPLPIVEVPEFARALFHRIGGHLHCSVRILDVDSEPENEKEESEIKDSEAN
jgi:hypothetical protein